jgi:hypothetical protein
MGKESTSGVTDAAIRESTTVIRSMDGVSSIGRMVLALRALGSTVKDMEKALIT